MFHHKKERYLFLQKPALVYPDQAAEATTVLSTVTFEAQWINMHN